MSDQIAGLFQYPEYYDSLFKRNYGAETDFLEACLQRHGAATERSFLELGCGPARNSREFLKRGYRAVALDLQRSMLEHAQREANREGGTLELVEGNLIDFDLAKPVGLTACMWDTILLVVTNADMIRHLRAVSRNLLPGGIYVIETSHPSMYLQPYSGIPFQGRAGDTKVEMTWGQPDDAYDCIEQIYTATIRTVARRNGELVAQAEEKLQQRYYHVQEMRALIELSGAFREVHYYGKTALPFLPLSMSPECDGMLTVLVKA